MDETLSALEPAALDSWLREQLGRRMVMVGVSLAPPAPSGAPPRLAAPPAKLLAGLSAYAEVWVRWSDMGTTLSAALRDAAQYDADVVLAWLGSPHVTEPAPDDWPCRAVAALIGEADDLNLRDRCVFALAGPAASRTLARQMGCDEGFAPDTPLAQIAGILARESVARDEFRRTGSSPPCYL